MSLNRFERYVQEASLFPDRLSTGIDPLDRCLPHGVARGLVTEICGPQGTGRSTLLLQLAAVTLEDPHVHLILVDFKRDLYWSRLLSMLLEQPWACVADIEADIKPRVHFNTFTYTSQFTDFLEGNLQKTITEIRRTSSSNIVLLLIDNIQLPFKWFTETDQGEMLVAIRRIGSILRLLTTEFHLYTIVCNGLSRKLDIERGTRRLIREYFLPALGKPWMEFIDTRMLLEKADYRIKGRIVYCWCGSIHKGSDGGSTNRTNECMFMTTIGGIK